MLIPLSCQLLIACFVCQVKGRGGHYAPHLLGKHHSRRRQSTPPDPWDREQLDEARKVSPALDDLGLFEQLDVRIVHVPGGNHGRVAKTAHGCVGLGVAALLHQPTGRLGTHEDHDGERDGGDEGGSELQAPGNVADVFDGGVGAET